MTYTFDSTVGSAVTQTLCQPD